MLISPRPLSTLLRFFVISFALSFTSSSLAQTGPLGLYEGLMGNTGSASFESSAASYYNPALLLQRAENSFSVGGYAIASTDIRVPGGSWRGNNLAPTYVSAVQRFESFVHEFFAANVFSIDGDFILQSESNTTSDVQIRSNAFLLGYSMAFAGLPMGFQAVIGYNELRAKGFSRNSQPGVLESISTIQGGSRFLNGQIGIFGANHFGEYQLGYGYRTRSLRLSKQEYGTLNSYVFNDVTDQFSSSSGNYNIPPFQSSRGQSVRLGHAFRIGAHEFLTDTLLSESDSLSHTYQWVQTFGYRLGLSEKLQYLVGIQHLIANEVKYFGQSAYVATGLSWLKNTYRSAVGIFSYSDTISSGSESRILGLSFSNEFSY
jgi:hypothetical protein